MAPRDRSSVLRGQSLSLSRTRGRHKHTLTQEPSRALAWPQTKNTEGPDARNFEDHLSLKASTAKESERPRVPAATEIQGQGRGKAGRQRPQMERSEGQSRDRVRANQQRRINTAWGDSIPCSGENSNLGAVPARCLRCLGTSRLLGSSRGGLNHHHTLTLRVYLGV